MKFLQLFAILALLGVAFSATQANIDFKLGTWADGSLIVSETTKVKVGTCSTNLMISMQSTSATNDDTETYSLTFEQATDASDGGLATVAATSNTVQLGTTTGLNKVYNLPAAEVAKFTTTKNFLKVTWSDTATAADTVTSGKSPFYLILEACGTADHKIQLGASTGTPADITSSTAAIQVGDCNASGVTFSIATVRRSLATSVAFTAKYTTAADTIAYAYSTAVEQAASSSVDFAITKTQLVAMLAQGSFVEISASGDVGSTTGVKVDPVYVQLAACPVTHKVQIGASPNGVDITGTSSVLAGDCNPNGVTFSVAGVRRSMSTSLTWVLQKTTASGTAGTAYSTAVGTTTAATTLDFAVDKATLVAMQPQGAFIEIIVTGDVDTTTAVIAKTYVAINECPTHKIQIGASGSEADISTSTPIQRIGTCNANGVRLSVAAISSSRRELTTSLSWTFMYAATRGGATSAYTTSVDQASQSTTDVTLSTANLTGMVGQGPWVKAMVSGDFAAGTTITGKVEAVWFQIGLCPTHTIQLNGNAITATTEVQAGSCAANQAFTIAAITSRRELATYAWTVEGVTDMTGATTATLPTAAQPLVTALTKNTDTLTIPAATVSAFRGSADAFVKVSIAHTPDTGSAVIEPVVVKVVACPAPVTATTNSQVLAFFSAVLALIALLI